MVMATSNKTDLLKLKAAAMAKKSKRPLEEDMDVELKAVLEKLNSDDDEVWFKGIVVLEEAARSSGEGTKILVDYFESSPDCTEILSSLQGETLRDNGKTRAVLQLLQTFMENRETEQLRSHVQRLATRLVRKLSKILASGLSLSNPRLSATVLTFISKITEVGVIQARDCWKRFSPHLNTISKLLEPPKDNAQSKHERDAAALRTRALQARGTLEATEHGGLMLAGDARDILKGEAVVAIVVPPRAPKSAAAKKARGVEPTAYPADDPLFETLRGWRRETAVTAKVPPYVIFHDSTLREIALHRPATMAVGARKLEAHGAALLALLRGA